MSTDPVDQQEVRGRRIAVAAVLLSVAAPLVGLMVLSIPGSTAARLIGYLLTGVAPVLGVLLAVIGLSFPGAGRWSAAFALVAGLVWIGVVVVIMAGDTALIG